MKHTGKVIRVNQKGKIIIPPHILKQIGIKDKTTIEFIATENAITFKKRVLTCLVTGITSENVSEILPGIYLSKEGMEVLLKELNNKNICPSP
ncbi:hypothetical protein [Sporosarcina sp. FSL K6-1508]|uniref:hypothetical protein n=1 Tax=Sporosarcina sp. FSL K6-1508 TaxID=2921553 RepID=UPI0030F565F5